MNKNGNEITITEEESKTCKVCDKRFDSPRKRMWHIKKEHKLDFEEYVIKFYYDGVIPKCLKTGKSLSFKAHQLGPWFKNYTKNCFPRNPHSQETKNKIRDGCEKNSIKKYGVKNVFQSDWCKEKIKNTMIERYGVENIMKTSDMRDLFSTFQKSNTAINKTKVTNNQKYGFNTFTSSDEGKMKIRKYAYTKHYNNWDKYLDQLENLRIKCKCDESYINDFKKIKFECNSCNCQWEDTLLIPFCPECDKKFKNSRSIVESNIMKWLSEYKNINFLPNKRFNINGKIYEADLFFPDFNIVIELHGLYWHSENGGKKDKNYHIKKLESFESIGFTVFQIFEDEWLFKNEIIKNKILYKLKISKNEKVYARNCNIKKISMNDCKNFLNSTHIQGFINSKYCYGAYYKDELVSVMTFSNNRISLGNKNVNNDEFELVRFSTTSKYNVIGIAGKLLSHFIKNHSPQKIISYADRRWSNEKNNVYKSIGFVCLNKTKPNYWYIKKYKREHRFKFCKHKLVKMGHDSNLTEWEIMQTVGYDRIWDCGHLKFEWSSQ